MIAIILAAGECTRLRPLTESTPKCLLKVGGYSILERQLAILQAADIEHVYVVTGYKGSMIVQHIKDKGYQDFVKTIHNANYDKTNNGFSLEMALDQIKTQPFLLMNGDVVCDPGLVFDLLSYSAPNAGAVVKKDEIIPEDMKVIVHMQSNTIMHVSKEITEGSCGEFTGVAKFNKAGAILLLQSLKYITAKQWFEHALDFVLPKMDFRAVDVTKHKFIEIDTEDDLLTAYEMFGE